MTYWLDPFGCVKNQVDAENMMAFLNQAGWAAAENAENADLIIVNSCGFIESAKQESINAVLGWRKLYPGKKTLLAGCLAQRYAKELAESLPEADGFFGTDDISGIAGAAAELMRPMRERRLMREHAARARLPADLSPGRRPLLSLPGQAYVKISEGCDNRCSFCAIPLIRGGLRSRGVADIVEECKALLDRGIKELCLIGQDTGSFGKDAGGSGTDAGGNGASPRLPDLMEALSRLEGGFWARLLYIHPDNFPLEILDIMEADGRFLPYFDLPFQHGSEKILRAMNRRGGAETYLELIAAIRRRLKWATIRSTFLTGFPGETEEDFERLLDFQEKARLDWLGCFAYSREENTPAFDMKGRVAKKTAAARKRIVEERQIPITESRMDRFVGAAFDVLIEEKFDPLGAAPGGEENSGETPLYLGRLPCQAPEVDGSGVIFSGRLLETGSLVPCRVVARRGFDLELRV